MPERLWSVRVAGRTLELVEGQQHGPEAELWRRRPDEESQVGPTSSVFIHTVETSEPISCFCFLKQIKS